VETVEGETVEGGVEAVVAEVVEATREEEDAAAEEIVAEVIREGEDVVEVIAEEVSLDFEEIVVEDEEAEEVEDVAVDQETRASTRGPTFPSSLHITLI